VHEAEVAWIGTSDEFERISVRIDVASRVQDRECSGVVGRATAHKLRHQRRFSNGTTPRYDDGKSTPADDARVHKHQLWSVACYVLVDVAKKPPHQFVLRVCREHDYFVRRDDIRGGLVCLN